MPSTDLWDQPRIAREFGVAPNTVQSTWRNNSLRTIREHVDAALATPAHAGHADEVRAQLGPYGQLTRKRWEEVRYTYGLPTVRMPSAALPLPDIAIGTKPAWTEKSMLRWARDTKRCAADGTLRRSSPPGRPAGIVETGPRQQRREAAVA